MMEVVGHPEIGESQPMPYPWSSGQEGGCWEPQTTSLPGSGAASGMRPMGDDFVSTEFTDGIRPCSKARKPNNGPFGSFSMHNAVFRNGQHRMKVHGAECLLVEGS